MNIYITMKLVCLHCESLFSRELFISLLYQFLQPGLDYAIEIWYFRFPSLIVTIRFIVCSKGASLSHEFLKD